MPPEYGMNYKQMALAVEMDDLGHRHNLYQDLATAREMLRERNKDGFPNVWQNFLHDVNKEIKAHPDSDAAKMLNGLEICGLESRQHIVLRDKENHRRVFRDPQAGDGAPSSPEIISPDRKHLDDSTPHTPESTKPKDSHYDRHEKRDKASSIMQQAAEQNMNSPQTVEPTQGLQWRSTPFAGDKPSSPTKHNADDVLNRR